MREEAKYKEVWLPLLEAAEFALRAIDSKDPRKYARMPPDGKLVYAADELEKRIEVARRECADSEGAIQNAGQGS